MTLTLKSGGQTGADRTALEIAEELGIPTGGWCPLSGKTDDGPDPELMTRFHLKETNDRGYHNRTIMNVREAELIAWYGDETSPGGQLTTRTAKELCVPVLINPEPDVLLTHLLHPDGAPRVSSFMVAGNRKRTNPGVVALVQAKLRPALVSYLKLVKDGGGEGGGQG